MKCISILLACLLKRIPCIAVRRQGEIVNNHEHVDVERDEADNEGEFAFNEYIVVEGYA